MARRLIASVLFTLITIVAFGMQSGVIKEVLVRGNVNISQAAILAAMKSKPGGPYIAADLPKDEEAILNLGFFKDVKVLSRGLTDTEWQLIVEIDENPVIKEIRVVGNTVIKTDAILKKLTQEVGKVFNLRTVGPSSDAITKLYEDKGYFAQADISPLAESPGTLNVQVVERTVKDIFVSGNTRTRPSVLRKLLKTRPGQAFSEVKWEIDRRRLESTQWFENVNARARPTDDIGKFDLLLDVKEARTAQVGFGVALDPTSRLAGNIRYSDSNFNGSGQTVGLTLQQDTQGAGTSAGIDYTNPWLDDRDTSMTVRIYSRVYSYFTNSSFGSITPPGGNTTDARFDERRNGAGLSFERPFRGIYSAGIGGTFENIQTVNLKNTTSQNYIRQDGGLATFNLSLAMDRRDVPLDPQSGDYARILLEPGLSNIHTIGGDVSGFTDILGKHKFLRTTLEYKRFFSRAPRKDKPIDTPRPVIAFRARYGAIKGTLPFFEQFFIGGSDSLRGYPDQRFWGKQQFLTSLEYRQPIQKNFNLIGFVDYGGAWGGYNSINQFKQTSTPKLNLGYGFGIGFRTPLGPIRIDFGFTSSGKGRTHFSIGPSF